MQCEIVLGRSNSDDIGDQCRRSAVVTCHGCGNEVCGAHSDSCYECGFNFCNPHPCLDDHAKATGHQIDLPKHAIPMSGELIEALFETTDAILAVNRG